MARSTTKGAPRKRAASKEPAAMVAGDIVDWVNNHESLVRALMQGEVFINLEIEHLADAEVSRYGYPKAEPDRLPPFASAREPSTTAQRKAEKLANFRSSPVTVTVFIHRKTTKAVQVSLDGNIDEDAWVPRSLTWIKWLGDGWAEITIPEQIARQKGLI